MVFKRKISMSVIDFTEENYDSSTTTNFERLVLYPHLSQNSYGSYWKPASVLTMLRTVHIFTNGCLECLGVNGRDLGLETHLSDPDPNFHWPISCRGYQAHSMVQKTGFDGRFKMNFLDTWKVSPKATVQGRGAIKTAACWFSPTTLS